MAHLIVRPSPLDNAWQWFHRLVALSCLVMGIAYWVRLVGFYDGALWRFDLMPLHWQIASIVLSVLYPFAAVGLWMLAPWGAVIWFLCAGTEVAMHGVFAELFGRRDGLLAAHLLVALVYALFRIARYLHKRRSAV